LGVTSRRKGIGGTFRIIGTAGTCRVNRYLGYNLGQQVLRIPSGPTGIEGTCSVIKYWAYNLGQQVLRVPSGPTGIEGTFRTNSY